MQSSTAVSAVAGALISIVVWVIVTFAGIAIPAEIAAAATTVVMVVLTHFVPDKPTPAPNSASGV